MYPELTQFKNWLKCQYPGSRASVHYISDLALFFLFVKKPPSKISAKDIDRYIFFSLRLGHRPSTINRRLSAIRTFYYFLCVICDFPAVVRFFPDTGSENHIPYRGMSMRPISRRFSDKSITFVTERCFS